MCAHMWWNHTITTGDLHGDYVCKSLLFIDCPQAYHMTSILWVRRTRYGYIALISPETMVECSPRHMMLVFAMILLHGKCLLECVGCLVIGVVRPCNIYGHIRMDTDL